MARIDNDLWIIDSDGKPMQRLTFVGRMKIATTWSPDGEYVAYSISTPIGEEKAIVIVDDAGRELSKIILQPKTDVRDFQDIRWVSRIIWEKTNVLWSYSSVGRFGGFIDIWELDSSLHGSHKKRIEVMGWGCEFATSKHYVACIVEIFEIGMKKSFLNLEIYDTSKREFPEFDYFKDNYFKDRDPRTIELKQIERVDKIRFTSDNANVIIIGADKKYKFNMLHNKLSEIKELPPDVTIKSFPKVIKIKKDEKELSAEVFDMYCGQSSNMPK